MKISVCMATFNGERFIEEQLGSILSQLRPSDELIISDDGSADRTVEVIERFCDRRVRLFANSFHSPIRNFEFTLSQASGDVVFLSDQDDVWSDNKVKTVIDLMDSCDLIVSDCEVIDEDGKTIYPSFFALHGSSPGLIRNFIRNSYLGCCMAMKRNIVEKALPFPPDIPMHDMWLGIVAELFGTPCFCREKLVKYRRHGGNATYTAGVSRNSLMQKARIRWNLARSIASRLV